MDSMEWFGIMLVSYLISIWIVVILLIMDIIGVVLFFALLAILTLILFIPFIKIGGTDAYISNDTLHIKAPMVNLSIPLCTITQMEFRQEFKPGLRMFGYGGLKRGYGDFTNDEFSSYIYAGDSRIPRFIVIRYGKGKVTVFNYKDTESTETLYHQISAGTDAGPIISSDTTGSKKRRSKNVKLFVGFIVIGAIFIAAIAIIMLSVGHVDVSMDDDSITIDATMMKKDIRYDKIDHIELRDDFNAGKRVGGYSTPKFSTGNFKNAEFGKYKLAIHKGVMPVVVIYCLNGDVVVFNTNDPDCTRAMAEELNGHLKADVKLHDDPKLFLPSSACDEYLASSRIQLTYT